MSSASPEPDKWVICLCAEWCGVCREWRGIFDEVAAENPHVRFAWVDVEDEAEAMGDVDIETFPTVLVAQGIDALFLGPLQPSAAQLRRLVTSLFEGGSSSSQGAQATALLARLRAQVLLDR